MNFWIGNWAGELFSLVQIFFLLPVAYYSIKDFALYRRNRIEFENFEQFQKKFDVNYSAIIGVFRLISITFLSLTTLLFFLGQLWLLGLFLLIELYFLFLTFGIEITALEKNKSFQSFFKSFKTITAQSNKLDNLYNSQSSILNSIEESLDSLTMIDLELSVLDSSLSLQKGIDQYHSVRQQFTESIKLAETQIEEYIALFNKSLIDYIQSNHKEKVISEVKISLPKIDQFQGEIQAIMSETFARAQEQLASVFQTSTFSPSAIEKLIETYTRHKLPLETPTKQKILNKLAIDFSTSNDDLDRIIEFFYLKNLINRDLIIDSLAKSFFPIINKGVFSYLSNEEILNVLQLLIDENSKQGMIRFLKNIPKHLFYLLYQIPKINANEAEILALRFREFSPLKFEFSDPSVNLYSMYEALLNSSNELPFSIQPNGKFGKALLEHKDQIIINYLAVYEEMEPLLRYMESIKLNLLSSSIQNSPAIRVSSAIELFYDFTTNLKKQDASILLHYIEAIFLHEETNLELLDEFKTPFNEFNGTAHYFDLKTAAKVSKMILRNLLQDRQQALLSIIAQVERQRLSFDLINQWVTT